MKIETKKKALLNSLIISKLHSSNKDELEQAINELKGEYHLTIDQIIIETGLSRSSIYSYLAGRNKMDKTQVTNRVLKKVNLNLDLDILIEYFRHYRPRSNEDRLKVQTLYTLLLDCLKPRK